MDDNKGFIFYIQIKRKKNTPDLLVDQKEIQLRKNIIHHLKKKYRVDQEKDHTQKIDRDREKEIKDLNHDDIQEIKNKGTIQFIKI